MSVSTRSTRFRSAVFAPAEAAGGSPDPASASAPRCVALVGPQGAGKTSLLESLLAAAGAVSRKGTVAAGNTVGDADDISRARGMSTETTVASFEHAGDSWTVLDCPGSLELAQDAFHALMAADLAVVVCEPDPSRALALAPLLRFLDGHAIPHLLFVNKMDTASTRMRDVLAALQAHSARPLVLRQVPIREGEAITGYVDLVSERAYAYKAGQASDLVRLPDTVADREQEARQEMLEALADFDDSLLEQLLEDVQPAADEVYRQLHADIADDLIVPVLLGAAERDGGVRRLMKALRHDVPEPARTAERLGVPDGAVVAGVFRTHHAPHAGKLSFARVWRGTVTDGMSLGGGKVSGLHRHLGDKQEKIASAGPGAVVSLGRMDAPRSGDVLTADGREPAALWPEPLVPVFFQAIHAENRNEEVKLSGALQKLSEEDAALTHVHDPDTGELVIGGQGDIHLQIAIERLKRRFNVTVTGQAPAVPYKESIRRGTKQHSRFKRQTGGHGQFADVHIEVSPLGRGEGFAFTDSVVGGAVPKQYIPAVEAGAKDALARGPLGFPVVDVAVDLSDGQYHSVDSSEQAFRTCGRQAVTEALAACEPVLLEPIAEVSIFVPSEATPKAQRVLSQRRGQILGFDARPGWDGWDEVKAYLPQAEMHDLIIELRSITQGVGSYIARFDHLQPLDGRLADRVVETRQGMVAAQ
ncbi:MAG: elongation factor G [Azospirillaceae bacterium]